MTERAVTKLIQRLEEEFPEETHPDVAEMIRHLKLTYEREVRTKSVFDRLGVSFLSEVRPEDMPFWKPPTRTRP